MIIIAFIQLSMFILLVGSAFIVTVLLEQLKIPLFVYIPMGLLLWYLVFLFLLIVFYRLFLRTLRKKEGIFSKETGRRELNQQDGRIFLDYVIVNLVYPLTLFFPVFLKLLGVRMGKNTCIPGKIYNGDLVELGDNVIIGVGAIVFGHIGYNNMRILQKVKIGNNCTIGIKSIIFPGVEIGEGSVIAAAAVVPMGVKIPPGEIWGGIPAKKIKDALGV